jgi:hypothetical protein
MTKDEIEQYMEELLNLGTPMDRLPSKERKQLFQQSVGTVSDFSVKQFLTKGLKGTFGLSNQHRINISNTMKAKHKDKNT